MSDTDDTVRLHVGHPFALALIDIARSQIGVRELARNRGPEVDEYLRSVGLDPTKGSYAWCVAFVHWSAKQAAERLGMLNPCPRTAGVHKLWRLGERFRVEHPQPGRVFLIDHGQGKGHAGIVVSCGGTHFITIEGNTNDGGGREGDGVYQRARRYDEVTLGCLDLTRTLEPVAGS